MKKTLTEKRADYLKQSLDIATINSTRETRSKRGGHNARTIGGYTVLPTAGWCRAAHIAGLESQPWWHGSAPTPSNAFPIAVYDAIKSAPKEIL